MNTRTLFGPLSVSVVSIVVCLIAFSVQAPPLLGALLSPNAEAVEDVSRVDELKAQHPTESDLLQSRFRGRSAFFLPTRPTVPIKHVATADAAPPADQLRPAPSEYGGVLQPSWSLGDTVMFKRGAAGPKVALKLGETSSGVHVLEINPPWSVKVSWTRPAQGHISYEEGIYDIRFWNDSTEGGDNAPLLAEAPDNPERLKGLEGAPGASPLQTRIGGPGTTRFDDDEDEEDSEDSND